MRKLNLLYGASRISGTKRDIVSKNLSHYASLPKELYGRLISRRGNEKCFVPARGFATLSGSSHLTDVRAFLLI